MNMQLTRREDSRQLVSLVPMIDVMLILLVFFMVTSTYLNLDMIPFVERSRDAPSEPSEATGEAATLLVRIGSDGQTYVRGRPLGYRELDILVRQRIAENPLLNVVLLPSTQAETQHLVSAMDALTQAGASRLRLMQLEAAE